MYDTRPAYFESREEAERACARARGFESREAMLSHYETRDGPNVAEADDQDDDRRRLLRLKKVTK